MAVITTVSTANFGLPMGATQAYDCVISGSGLGSAFANGNYSVSFIPNVFTPVAWPTPGPPQTLQGTAPLTITGTTGSGVNPILITTFSGSVPSVGGPVMITGVQGNTAANGSWAATYVSPNSFSIPTTGNGTYSGGGVATVPTSQTFGGADFAQGIRSYNPPTGTGTSIGAACTAAMQALAFVAQQSGVAWMSAQTQASISFGLAAFLYKKAGGT
jgi:hypothetical protein